MVYFILFAKNFTFLFHYITISYKISSKIIEKKFGSIKIICIFAAETKTKQPAQVVKVCKKNMTTKQIKKQKTIDAAGVLAFALIILSAVGVTTYSVISNL